ncbi:hypothetical protein MVES_000695 [Malassezia vespertilionis]|uniref:Uncharacterized protein n=1 Tax=Malassezia vespertilionis TaxID=2020962 RepID=A0A2N1JFV6_9BASI|nr:hypothetical protein MVES_000695 [Malassezia vespertilionis]
MPSEEYDRAFLKQLVARSERALADCGEEDESVIRVQQQDWAVEEGILQRYVELISIPTERDTVVGVSAPRSIFKRQYFPVEAGNSHSLLGVCDSVVLREEGVAISQGTTGLKTWYADQQYQADTQGGQI